MEQNSHRFKADTRAAGPRGPLVLVFIIYYLDWERFLRFRGDGGSHLVDGGTQGLEDRDYFSTSMEIHTAVF